MIKVYKGTGGGYPAYTIDGDRIYNGTGGGYPVYTIDGDRIYNGTGGGYPVYTIDGDRIYNGTGGGYPVYTIENIITKTSSIIPSIHSSNTNVERPVAINKSMIPYVIIVIIGILMWLSYWDVCKYEPEYYGVFFAMLLSNILVISVVCLILLKKNSLMVLPALCISCISHGILYAIIGLVDMCLISSNFQLFYFLVCILFGVSMPTTIFPFIYIIFKAILKISNWKH